MGRGYLIPILVPSSSSSWCGRGGRCLMTVRGGGVDERCRAVDIERRFVVGSWATRWTGHDRAEPQMDSSPSWSTSRRGFSGACRSGCPHRPPVLHRFGPFVHIGTHENRFRNAGARRPRTAFVELGRGWQGAAEDRSERPRMVVSEDRRRQRRQRRPAATALPHATHPGHA